MLNFWLKPAQLLKDQCSPPQPVIEEAAAAPPAEEDDMGSRSSKKPSSRALNPKKEGGEVRESNALLMSL